MHETQSFEDSSSHPLPAPFRRGCPRQGASAPCRPACRHLIHAAALKQVPSCEYNPFKVVKTNILGAANIIDAGVKDGVLRNESGNTSCGKQTGKVMRAHSVLLFSHETAETVKGFERMAADPKRRRLFCRACPSDLLVKFLESVPD
jgi:hypothetical protein